MRSSVQEVKGLERANDIECLVHYANTYTTAQGVGPS